MKILDFPTETDRLVAASVRALASGHDESIDQVAASCAMTKSALYERLKGARSFKAHEVAALAHHFRVQVGDLYDGLGGRFGPPPGASSSMAELRTFNPESLGAKVLTFPTGRPARSRLCTATM
ncbi:MAG: hypothetical protein J2P16_14410 [Mycobacterium sp.]|nr:hypothetical protein [Mycobacterium sp.]